MAITASYQAARAHECISAEQKMFLCKGKVPGTLRWLSRARDGRGGGCSCGAAFRADTSVCVRQALKAVKRSVDLARHWAASWFD